MRPKILIIGFLLTQQISAQTYKEIHDKAIVVDTHNDFLMLVTDSAIVQFRNNVTAFDKDMKGKTHTDMMRQKEGGLDVQIFSVFCTGDQQSPFRFANKQIDSFDAVIGRHPSEIVKVTSLKELLKTVKQHKLAAMLGVEGGHMIEDDLSRLDTLYHRGARYMTLTWNNSTSWATSAFDETFKKVLPHPGLTDFGKQVVSHMNQLGMIVDVSHVGEKTFRDVISTTSKPVMASHSSVYNLCHHQRNLKDDQIKAIAKNGGVIQINFNPGFIDSSFERKAKVFIQNHQAAYDSLVHIKMDDWLIEYYLYRKYPDEANAMRPPLSLLIPHIEYVIRLVGVDYVGLGSDFDGITLTPQALDDVTDFPLITKALVEKGYSKKDIDKILGGNFLRVLKANEANNQ